ncbi:MAG: glycosyltransferase [Candidatus Kryptoniota bacterium]
MSKGSFGLDVLIVVSSDPRYDSRSTKYLNSLLQAGLKAKVVGVSSDGAREKTGEMVRVPITPTHGKRFFLHFYQRIIPEVRKSPAKIVIAGDLFSLPPAIINKRRYSRKGDLVKLIYDSKELYEELPSLKMKHSSFLFWNLIEKSSIRFVDAVMTVNHSIANILEAKWHMPPTVIMNVPDKFVWTETSKKSFDKIVLTFSGGLQRGRGLDKLIKLLSLLPENYELRFVGDGNLRSELEYQAASMKLSSRVHFIGKVKNTEVLGELSKAHLGIYLMENVGLCHYLALPNKLFQFISARLPVIVPDFPEMANIVEKFRIGAAINPSDLAGAVKKILELTNNQELYRELVSNCDKAAEILNWQVEKEKFLSLVKSLI